ncbi:MAG: radical SAM protein [Bryobacteraceae bacterium]|jgi:radical SAM protein with 4Fe4S-binding SPASM domain
MSSLMEEISKKAWDLGIPLNVQFDLTYRCNERCIHCYLDHHDHGEMTTAEIKAILDQLAEAGVLSLVFSGGEILLRKDLFEILEHARSLLFQVRLKTDGILIREDEAKRIRNLGVSQVQISIYSHRPEVHDGITKVPGSLERSIRAIRFLKSQGIEVTIANVLMRQNMLDYPGVRALGAELGASVTIDPTITPKIDGDNSVTALRIPEAVLKQVFNDEALVGNVQEFCAPPAAADESALDGYSCSAGHTFCYVSPYGDVYPCVQFPLPCGNLRRQSFLDIWRGSRELEEVRSIRVRDLPTCSGCVHAAGCTRCPGLAYMEGDMRGPSSADCEKSYTRTGIPTANMNSKARRAQLVQIQSLLRPPAPTQALQA